MRLLAVLVMLTTPAVLHAQTSRNNDAARLRKYRDIHLDAKAFILRSKKAESDRELIQAVLDMCKLHAEIVGDPRYAGSDNLQGYRGTLWRRLTSIKQDVEARIARRQREQQRLMRKLKTEPVAYRQVRDDDALAGTMAESYSLAGNLSGGPARLMEYSGDGLMGGLPADMGWDLVELITETLDPDFWDVNGGPGKAYYYRPLMVLVVRATTRVHEDLEDFLEMIR